MNEKEHITNPESDMEETHHEAFEDASQAANESEEAAPVQSSMEQELEDLKTQNQEQKDKYLRLYAEFDTYKRRAMRDKLDYMATAAQDTLTALLPVLDDFDRAKKAAESENSTEPFSEGVNLVYQKLHNTLKGVGLTAMETTGQVFDPEFHEALAEIPAPSEDMKGKIIDTVATGYLLKDKIIRHAKVVVGK